jgi:hypothetical protein
MKCSHCNSKWDAGANVSSTLASCPFCGKSLVKEEEPKSYENSKDALAAIMNKHGVDVLLGDKLKAHFSDYAPSVSQNQKGLVYAVYEKGAAKVLKKNLNASQADKEIAVKIALRNLTDAFIAQDAAERIIYEFIDALGWKLGRSEPVLSPVSVPPSAPPQPVSPPPGPSNPPPSKGWVYGNTPGNIANGGYVAMKGDWVYYRNWSVFKGGLYKIRTDGTGRQKLNNNHCTCINIAGDWVYYCNGSDKGKLYRIRTDGTERQKLYDDKCDQIIIVDGWVYYSNNNNKKGGPAFLTSIYRIRTDGSGRQKLADDALWKKFYVSGDWVYYVSCFKPPLSPYLISFSFCRMRTDGTGKYCFFKLDNMLFDFNVAGDWVYHNGIDGNSKELCKVRIDRSGGQKLMDGFYTGFNIAGDWVYYSNGSDESTLYKVRTDGTERQKLYDDKCGDIHIVGDWVYYCNYLNDKRGSCYKIRTDGTDRQLVE